MEMEQWAAATASVSHAAAAHITATTTTTTTTMATAVAVEYLETVRQPWMLVIVYSFFYTAVFLVGLVGNVFVVMAVVLNSNISAATDYLISSLALADLLIILFCLPTTLLNNLLTEWQLGSIGCKLSTFINSTTSCASIFTLVAVTADRYMAICHTMKYTIWEARPVIWMITGIWIISAILASPNLIIYDEILYDLLPPNGQLVARLCVSTQDDFLHFIIVNLIIAFLIPMFLISISYALIFHTVSSHQSLAVDAHIRDERIKLRVAQMMLTVIIVFVLCWSPLYGLYCYFFLAGNRESQFFQFASSVLRPIFQWLSLLSSSLNPLIYIAYSQKYRRAFHQLLIMPCQMHFRSIQRVTRAAFKMAPLSDESRDGEFESGSGGTILTNKYARRVSIPHHYYAPHQYSNGLFRKLSEQSNLRKSMEPMASNGNTPPDSHSGSCRRLPTYEFKLPLEKGRQPASRHSLSVPTTTPAISASSTNSNISTITNNGDILKSKMKKPQQQQQTPLSPDYEEVTDENVALIRSPPLTLLHSTVTQKRSQSGDLNTQTVKKIPVLNSNSLSRLSSVVAQI